MKIEIAEPGRMTQSGSSLLKLIQNNKTPILDLLVRESIQNSLDAQKDKLRKYAKEFPNQLELAITKAIDECIEEGVLMDILFRHRTLAKNTILTEYNEKKRRKLDRQSGFEDGLACGIERGTEQTLKLIVAKKIRKNMTLDMIANDLEEDIKVIRPIYEAAKKEIESE